jgi:hypothetical protein
MAKLITLNFSGDFDKGFEITLRNEGNDLSQEVASLSSKPILPKKYQTWQKNHSKNIKIPLGVPKDKDYSDPETCIQNCKDSYTDLQNCFKSWLQESGGERCRSFIREQLSSLKGNEEQARIVIQTDNPKLGQLPWHEWEDDLFKDICLGRAAIAVGPKTFQAPNSLASIQPQDKVRILSILGQSDDLNTEFFHHMLNGIVSPEEAEIQLKQPQTKEELLTHLNQEWHIFFFAGHSASDDEGKVGKFYYLNQKSVEIEDLKYAIANALEKGLQLMIFNSCNGVGLANQLAELRLPQSIVMRENIPEEVALKFLEAFFTAFAKEGKSLYSAMLEARLSLREFEHKYPGIMSLPVIYQNSAVEQLSWNKLKKIKNIEVKNLKPLQNRIIILRQNSYLSEVYCIFDTKANIGRSQYCDIPLCQAPRKVSNYHAIICYDFKSQQYYIQDNNSMNGTYVDGNRIQEDTYLKLGSKIQLSQSLSFLFEHNTKDPLGIGTLIYYDPNGKEIARYVLVPKGKLLLGSMPNGKELQLPIQPEIQPEYFLGFLKKFEQIYFYQKNMINNSFSVLKIENNMKLNFNSFTVNVSIPE